MTDLDRKHVWWVGRVPETSTQAKALVAEEPATWQGSEALRWVEREVPIGDRTERWVVAQSAEGTERQYATLQRRAEQERQQWSKRLRELEQRPFACEADAQTACIEARKGAPPWLEVALHLEVSSRHTGRGRPRTDAAPKQVWTVHGTVSIVEAALAAEARRKARCIVATNVPETHKSAEALLGLYKAQSGGVERGFAFLKDPLFLASSVFVKKVERVMATGFVMVLCLLVYRLAEQRLRQRLGETGTTVPDQLKKPTKRPTMRWVFQCFEGISIVLVQQADLVEAAQVTGLTDVHLLILRLLGPPYEKYYELSK
jgi:transposase